MNKRIIDDVYEIVDDVLELHEKNKQKRIVVVGYFETIQEIMNTLIKVTEDITYQGGKFEDPEWTEYEDSFYMELADDAITTGEMWNDVHNKYLMMEADYAFVEEDFADDYFETNPHDGVMVFGFDDVHENEHDHSSHPGVTMTKDNKGFTFYVEDGLGYTRFKYYGNKVLNEDDIWDIILEEFC